MLVVRQEVDQCAADEVVEEEHHEEEVDLAETVGVVVLVEEGVHQEEVDLEHEVVEEDLAEVLLGVVDSVRRVVVSAAVEEVEQLCRLKISRRLGNGYGVVGILVSAGQTIPSVYEKGYVVSKLGGDDCKSLRLQCLFLAEPSIAGGHLILRMLIHNLSGSVLGLVLIFL